MFWCSQQSSSGWAAVCSQSMLSDFRGKGAFTADMTFKRINKKVQEECFGPDSEDGTRPVREDVQSVSQSVESYSKSRASDPHWSGVSGHFVSFLSSDLPGSHCRGLWIFSSAKYFWRDSLYLESQAFRFDLMMNQSTLVILFLVYIYIFFSDLTFIILRLCWPLERYSFKAELTSILIGKIIPQVGLEPAISPETKNFGAAV